MRKRSAVAKAIRYGPSFFRILERVQRLELVARRSGSHRFYVRTFSSFILDFPRAHVALT